jgi:hypothetical protein
MLLDVPRDDVSNLVGTRGPTFTRHLMGALTGRFKRRPFVPVRRASDEVNIPYHALVRLKWDGEATGHWVVRWSSPRSDRWLDPSKRWETKKRPRGWKVTGYVELILR